MVDATDLKSVVRKGVRVRVPPSAPIGPRGSLNDFIINAMRAPCECSVAWRLSSVAQRLSNVNTPNVCDISQIGDRPGNAQYACVTARR